MKFGVVVFPWSNVEEEVIYVLKNILEQPVVKIWHKDLSLQDSEGIIISGGFFPEGYINPESLLENSPVLKEVIKFANNGGFVLGTGSGFQILCALNLLPGQIEPNVSGNFICKNIYLKADNSYSSVTNLIDTGRALKIPIAHHIGKYTATSAVLQEMRRNKQILFKYCDHEGNLTEHADPTGSDENIAGLCNTSKNIYGIIPQPERAADIELGNIDGRLIFESILNSYKLHKI